MARRATIIVLALSLTGWSSALADRIEDARDLVRALASVGGVAGNEGQVRAAIRKAAPTWVAFQEDNLGAIQPGKLADLVVLDRDYLTIPADQIKDIKPVLTMVGGRIVYDTSAVNSTK